MFDANKRKFPRANYPCALTVWRSDGSSEVLLANTANIGAGGLCVHSQQQLYVNAKVEVRVDFHKPNATPFKSKGVVTRAELIPGATLKENYYKIAIQFENLDDIKIAYLQGLVSELIDLENKGKA